MMSCRFGDGLPKVDAAVYGKTTRVCYRLIDSSLNNTKRYLMHVGARIFCRDVGLCIVLASYRVSMRTPPRHSEIWLTFSP